MNRAAFRSPREDQANKQCSNQYDKAHDGKKPRIAWEAAAEIIGQQGQSNCHEKRSQSRPRRAVMPNAVCDIPVFEQK